MAFARDVFLPAAISPGQTDFTISFPYIASNDVNVLKDGVLQTVGAGNDYILFDASTIRFNAGLAGTETIVLQRKTNQTARLVDYTVPSTLTEADLDTDSLQAFYMVQEALDTAALALGLDSTENWDAQSKRIKNLSAGTDGTDAVNKNQLDAVSILSGNVPTPDNPGENDYLLQANGGTFNWAAPATVREDLSVITAEGDLIVGSSSGTQERLAASTDGQVLQLAGGTPAWATVAVPTGSCYPYIATTAPAGWVLAEGGTIGNASSSGTARANADTEALFTLVWDNMADTEAPVSGGRGASAAADFAANKNIKLPDFRGRMAIGSGTGPDTAEGGGAGTARTHGGKGGTETHSLVGDENAPHRHFLFNGDSNNASLTIGGVRDFAVQDRQTGGSSSYTIGGSGTEPDRGESSESGLGDPHNNMGPWQALKYIIKL